MSTRCRHDGDVLSTITQAAGAWRGVRVGGLRHTRGVPELPEVETIRRQLAPALLGRLVVDAWAFPSGKFDEAPLAVGGRFGWMTRLK